MQRRRQQASSYFAPSFPPDAKCKTCRVLPPAISHIRSCTNQPKPTNYILPSDTYLPYTYLPYTYTHPVLPPYLVILRFCNSIFSGNAHRPCFLNQRGQKTKPKKGNPTPISTKVIRRPHYAKTHSTYTQITQPRHRFEQIRYKTHDTRHSTRLQRRGEK